MPDRRPFRFACRASGGRSRTRNESEVLARRAESLGYDTFGVSDHVRTPYSPLLVLGLVAMRTVNAARRWASSTVRDCCMNNMKSNGQPEPDHERILLDMIERVLSGEWTFDDFSKRYYDYYIDVLPETALEDKQREFFLEAQERLDWTDKNPDPVSRQFGWESPPEYLDWLRTAVAKYLAGRSGSH